MLLKSKIHAPLLVVLAFKTRIRILDSFLIPVLYEKTTNSGHVTDIESLRNIDRTKNICIFKIPILRNFVSFIIILDTFTWYFMLQMITQALELKEERKDAKRMKNEKGGLDA